VREPRRSALLPYTTLFRSGLSGAMGYNADIISPEGARAIGDRFVALLRALCQNPLQGIGETNVLSESDRTRLAEWNSTARQLPADRKSTRLNSSHVKISYA